MCMSGSKLVGAMAPPLVPLLIDENVLIVCVYCSDDGDGKVSMYFAGKKLVYVL